MCTTVARAGRVYAAVTELAPPKTRAPRRETGGARVVPVRRANAQGQASGTLWVEPPPPSAMSQMARSLAPSRPSPS